MERESKRSYTAEGAAALRAAGTYEADPGLRNPDTLAEQLIGWQYKLRVHVGPLRSLSLKLIERALPGIYLFVTARTKHFDANLTGELEDGVEQVVILGAGADSRAYRFAEELDGTPVHEVDHPATGAWKQQQVRRIFGALPEHVRYVPIEFQTESLEHALSESGAKQELRTCFLWEGVTPYLTPEAVDETLAAIARFAPGSSVVFDYFYLDAIEHPERYPDGQKYFAYLRRHGEPLVFGLDPERLEDYLQPRGFALVSNARAEDLSRLHLAGANGHLLSCSGIVHCRVNAA
jgi:methyltransferase (TIGR00027 family)